MAPLPVNNTPVYEVFYTNGTHQHSSQIRVGTISPATLGSELDALYTGFTGKMYATAIDFVTFRPAGSTVSNIVTTGIEGNTYGSGTPAQLNRPLYIDFVGRSTGGRHTRFTIFGCNDLGTDYRFVAGEDVAVDATITLLNASTQAWFAIDGLKAIWKSYANTGLNSYWQRKERP